MGVRERRPPPPPTQAKTRLRVALVGLRVRRGGGDAPVQVASEAVLLDLACGLAWGVGGCGLVFLVVLFLVSCSII